MTHDPRQGFDLMSLHMAGFRQLSLYSLMAGNCMSVPVIGSVLLAATWPLSCVGVRMMSQVTYDLIGDSTFSISHLSWILNH